MRGRHVALALVAAVVVSSLLFSSFLTHPRGVVDSLRAYGIYAERAGAASWHFHPWDYYLRLLIYVPASGTPVWTEALIVLLAVVGGAAGWRASGRVRRECTGPALPGLLHAADARRLLRDPLQDPLVPAGVPARDDPPRGRGCRRAAAGRPAVSRRRPWWASCWPRPRRTSAGRPGPEASGSPPIPRNPYVYAHTGTDVFEIVAHASKQLARAHPDGTKLPLQVISRENLWPLPWYLREFSRVRWWNGVPDDGPERPAHPRDSGHGGGARAQALRAAASGRARAVREHLRAAASSCGPRVELRGYATKTLWDAFRQLEAGP